MNVAPHPASLNLISLCTGGGGLDLGFELAVPGTRSVVCVEREAFAASHLVSAMQQGLMAPAAIWSDVTTFDGRPWRDIVDGLIGGIPCQPHSLAGRKRGSLDERDLWSDARKIIVRSRPWFVLIENVRGMLSAGSDEVAGAKRVWRDLRKLGFKVEIGLFTAEEVGAPHERERVFIFAMADGDGFRRSERLWHLYARQPDVKGRGHGLADADHPRLEGHRQSGERAGERIAGPGGGELDHTVSRRRTEIGNDHGSDVGIIAGAAGEHDLVDTTRERRGERRTEPELRSGRDADSGAGLAMVDAISSGYDGLKAGAFRGSIERAAAERSGGRTDGSMDDPAHRDGILHPRSRRPGQSSPDIGRPGPLFPPGPDDLHSWLRILETAPELEPAFRRVADGMASRLDIARVDRLRMLGNGVVSLQAAYAIRTLATRLAANGSAAAAFLVRMMVAA